MSKLSNVKYEYVNFGPYLMKTVLPDYIIKELKTHGKKTKQDYGDKLAGHLDHQFLYPPPFQKWFYNSSVKSKNLEYVNTCSNSTNKFKFKSIPEIFNNLDNLYLRPNFISFSVVYCWCNFR